MSKSKKQLIAEIAQVEAKLYCYKKNTLLHKEYIKSRSHSIALGFLAISTVLFIWFRKKNNYKKLQLLTQSIINIGKVALLNSIKKQVLHVIYKALH